MHDSFLSSFLPRFSFAAETFFSGDFCGMNNFNASQTVGHLHFVRRGPVAMEHADGSSIVAIEPTIIFYPRPYDHRLLVAPDAKAELVCANVQFREAGRNPLAQSLPPYLAIPLTKMEGVAGILDLLFARAATQTIGRKFIMDRLCDILVFEVIRHAMECGQLKTGVLTGFADTGIAKALARIHQDPARDWRVDTLAMEASMSRSKFAKKFHDLVGMSPAAYVADWRLSLAENLLRQNQTVKEVAASVGYGSPQSFARAFIDRTGLPPTQWAARMEKPDSSQMEESGR